MHLLNRGNSRKPSLFDKQKSQKAQLSILGAKLIVGFSEHSAKSALSFICRRSPKKEWKVLGTCGIQKNPFLSIKIS